MKTMLIMMAYIILFLLIIYNLHYREKLKTRLITISTIYTNTTELTQELYHTIALGLYERFKDKSKENMNQEKENLPSQEQAGYEENPFTFEYFVADIIEKSYGGTAIPTKKTGDFGVDIHHYLDDELTLWQVKCYAPENGVGYEPIALIHSNMVKQSANKGFVLTTSRFTTAAREYVEGLNIELLEGVDLAELWLNTLNDSLDEANELISSPELQLN